MSGIILSFHNGNSYDEIFTKVQQRSKDGTAVLVYSSAASIVGTILNALNGNLGKSNDTIKQLVKNI